MKDLILQKENEFIDRIDCNFPYLDQVKSRELITEASRISPNAMFTVIEEICRIPTADRKNVSIERLIELLRMANESFDHPLKSLIIPVAKELIYEREISVQAAIDLMNIIREYPGQYGALSIIYFSCDDVYGKLEQVWDEITKEWSQE